MKSLLTWKLIAKSLEQDLPVMLLYVIESLGSSPGRQGFFMAVSAAAEMEGSLGGGIMEHKFVEMALAKLQQQPGENLRYKQIHNASAPKHRSGMICSGEQTIWMYRCNTSDAQVINRIVNCLASGSNGLLQLSPSGIQLDMETPEQDFVYLQRGDEDWIYQEKIGYKNHLHIIGAGHCALALSRLMYGMDFYLHIYDNRPGLKTMDENRYIHQKCVLSTYSELSALVQPGRGQYVVIMTFGYRTDAEALDALLDKDVTYLGLLGSAAKIEKMFGDLRRRGVSEDKISRIHGPIGLPIKSQTPEEVAVSIAAEIIKVKNG